MKKKELKKISDSEILIVGLANNCSKTIKDEIKNIDISFSGFKKKNWLIVESDSNDNTFEILNSINDIENFYFTGLGILKDRFPKRTERIAY